METSTCAGGWSRRRFLKLASVSAAAGVLPRFVFAQGGAAAAGAPLSVGYVLGSEDAEVGLAPNQWVRRPTCRPAPSPTSYRRRW